MAVIFKLLAFHACHWHSFKMSLESPLGVLVSSCLYSSYCIVKICFPVLLSYCLFPVVAKQGTACCCRLEEKAARAERLAAALQRVYRRCRRKLVMLQEQAAYASSPAPIRRLTGALVAMLTKSPRRPACPEPHLSKHKRHRVKDFQKDP